MKWVANGHKLVPAFDLMHLIQPSNYLKFIPRTVKWERGRVDYHVDHTEVHTNND